MLNPRRYLHRVIRSMGLHIERHRDVYRDVARLLGPNGARNVVDGGAHHGGHSERLLSIFPDAVVHAFEPQQESYGIIEKKFVNERRVKTYPLALSHESTTASLYVGQQSHMTSLLQASDSSRIATMEKRDVRTTTLDSWAEENEIPAPELIKLDLQGHELDALKGGERLLENGVRILLIELNFRRRYENSCLFYEVADFLGRRGFELHRFYELILANNDAYDLADGLFVSNKLVK